VGDLQGGLYQGSLGHTDDARTSYEKALHIREALAAGGRMMKMRWTGFRTVYGRLGGLTWTLGDPTGAAEWYRKALEIDERLAAAHPDNLNKQYAVAGGYLKLWIHGRPRAIESK
jgi:hypothetical protein